MDYQGQNTYGTYMAEPNQADQPGDPDLIAEYQSIHATTGWGGTSVKTCVSCGPC